MSESYCVPFKHAYEESEKVMLNLDRGVYSNSFLYNAVYNVVKNYRPEYTLDTMELVPVTNKYENGDLLDIESEIVINYDSAFYIRKKGECLICYQNTIIMYTPCQHQLCSNCYNNVSICPFCRYRF